jgi:hypothetical protein
MDVYHWQGKVGTGLSLSYFNVVMIDFLRFLFCAYTFYDPFFLYQSID